MSRHNEVDGMMQDDTGHVIIGANGYVGRQVCQAYQARISGR